MAFLHDPRLQLDNNRVDRHLRLLASALAGVAREIRHKIPSDFRGLTAIVDFRRIRGPLRVSTLRKQGCSAPNGLTSVLGHD